MLPYTTVSKVHNLRLRKPLKEMDSRQANIAVRGGKREKIEKKTMNHDGGYAVDYMTGLE